MPVPKHIQDAPDVLPVYWKAESGSSTVSFLIVSS